MPPTTVLLVSKAAGSVFHRLRRVRPASFRARSTRTSTRKMASASSDASAFTLAYFDVMALGLPTGMVAAHSGLPWKGRDPETWDWQKVKHSDDAVFNQLPLLFRPGKRTVAHSTAIVGVIARMAHEAKTSVGYDGSCNEDDECVSLMLIAEASDIYAALQKGQPTIYVEIGKGGKTETFHEELWGNEGRIALKRHLKCLEKLIAHGDDDAFTSEKTAGEMFLWGVMHQVVLLDGDVFAATPKLKAFYERVLKLPETQAMLDGTSPMGTMKQYFVAGPVR